MTVPDLVFFLAGTNKAQLEPIVGIILNIYEHNSVNICIRPIGSRRKRE